MNVIKYKKWYLGFSFLLIILSISVLVFWGLKLSIDFTGGSRLSLSFEKNVQDKDIEKLKNTFSEKSIKVATVEKSGKLIFVRTSPIDENQNNEIIAELKKEFKDIKQQEFETIGPAIGKETTWNAIKAILISSVLIVIYITWSFRKVPKPTNSLRFGLCAIIALVHDVLIVLGCFAFFGHFLGVEVDSLFVTAILTIIGFSVHDTIVVFDRIRENLRREGGENFSRTINNSILQTIDRSLNTSLSVVLVLVAMLLFGGESIRWFVVALLIGICVGTYSSIFSASPLLVVWQEIVNKRKLKK